MTCREKLKQEHPEYIRAVYLGCCMGCPNDYGYKVKELCENPFGAKTSMYENCNACWEQEVEVEKKNDL